MPSKPNQNTAVLLNCLSKYPHFRVVCHLNAKIEILNQRLLPQKDWRTRCLTPFSEMTQPRWKTWPRSFPVASRNVPNVIRQWPKMADYQRKSPNDNCKWRRKNLFVKIKNALVFASRWPDWTFLENKNLVNLQEQSGTGKTRPRSRQAVRRTGRNRCG